MKNESGITLISLAITITVMLVIAVFAVYFGAGDNSVLDRSGDAVDSWNESTLKEELNMILADYTTGNILKQESATFDDFLNRKVAEGKIQEYKDEGEYIVKYKDVNCKLHKKGMTYEVSEIIGNE